MSEPITIQQLINAGIDAETASEFLESFNDTLTTRKGSVKKTLTGIDNEAQSRISDAIINSLDKSYVGTWQAGTTTFNTFNDYAEFNSQTYKPRNQSGITLPYVAQGADPTQLPDSEFIQPFSDIDTIGATQLITEISDIVYKASGGNSAVENMIAGTPVAVAVGDTCQCENGTIFKRIGNASGDIADFTSENSVNIKDFGADGGVDSTDKIKLALTVNGVAFAPHVDSDYIVNDNVSGLYGYNSPQFSGTGDVGYTNLLADPEPPLFSAGDRNAINYDGAQTVYLNGSSMVMGGFRFRGQYLNTVARSFPTPSFKNVVSLIDDLGAESTKAANNWYAVFAVANDGDSTCQFKLMPFLHLGSNNLGDLNRYRILEGGDNTYNADDIADLKGYDWGVGVDLTECLVITEGGNFSGRVTTITGGGSTPGSSSITLADRGSVSRLDWLLPAPKGYDFYRYCGSFYHDTAEVRNIADTGGYVGSRGALLLEVTDTGAVTKEVIHPYGNIPPLASGIRLSTRASFSTTTKGSYAEVYATDTSDHNVDEMQAYKSADSTQTIGSHSFEIPFSLSPTYTWSAGGSLVASRSGGVHLPWGYYEA